MPLPVVAIAFNPEDERVRREFDDGLAGKADVVFLPSLEDAARIDAFTSAKAVVVRGFKSDLSWIDPKLIVGKLIQTMIAGVDQLPFDSLPPGAMVAHNGGAFAPQMAEHIVGMILAAKKDLLGRHQALARGAWMQADGTRELRGDTCLIVGFGGIGKATAKLLRAFDVRIGAVNRSGRTDEPVDTIGTLASLNELLPRADIIVLSLGLNAQSWDLIDREALASMKRDATLVNVARGAVIDEAALFAHLQANPSFYACIDTWWGEPYPDRKFSAAYPFIDLPNVIGSPHNSATTGTYFVNAARHAVANVCRYLETGTAERLVTEADRP
jgi:glycerate dehydrogenase